MRGVARIELLTRPKATVIRDGQERSVDPSELVVGDILRIHAGDQIVVDGPVVGDGRLEVDESLLSGESNPITKQEGDILYSGSFCLTGSGYYRAEKVGSESVAGQLTKGARTFRRVSTPLQRQINSIIQSLLLVALYLESILVLDALANRMSVVDVVRMSVVIVGIVPIGLLLSSSVAYALAAVRIAGKNALVQRLSAIESLSNVEVLCLDKTGTLTTNALVLEKVHPFGIPEAQLRHLLCLYTAHISSQNTTSRAIGAACTQQDHEQALHIREEIPFSSAYKWSALAVDDAVLRGVYILGAPEILRPFLRPDADLGTFAEEETAQGKRVLLFACSQKFISLRPSTDEPTLPTGLTPLGMVSLRDELRPHVRETLAGFAEIGIQIKVISGDHPQTVAALAQQVGIASSGKVVSGVDLAKMDDAHFAQIAQETTIFGRITPQQKARLVQALRDHNHYVAMIGDGVNDVLALKQANLGIAMETGSQATRGVADIVLLKDSFEALPLAFAEGQRVRNGMHWDTRVVWRVLVTLQQIASDEIPLHCGNGRERKPAAGNRISRRIDGGVRYALQVAVDRHPAFLACDARRLQVQIVDLRHAPGGMHDQVSFNHLLLIACSCVDEQVVALPLDGSDRLVQVDLDAKLTARLYELGDQIGIKLPRSFRCSSRMACLTEPLYVRYELRFHLTRKRPFFGRNQRCNEMPDEQSQREGQSQG